MSPLFRNREREQEAYEQFLAHEIHDGVCQYAIGAQMALEAHRREAREAAVQWSHFDTGMALLNCAIEELRRLVRGLEPIHLAAGNLPAAIDCLIEEIRSGEGPEIDFIHNGHTDRIPRHLQRAAFRIVQESLANAYRHSRSKRLSVELALDSDALRIRVKDWGVGFDPENPAPGHFGLSGIRRRVELLHGTATIHSELGKGTCITVEIPLAP